MNRRSFHRHGLALLAAPLPTHARGPSGGLSATFWQSLERRSQGRLGAAVLDTRTGTLSGHRLDERFPMCSTFKWLAAALVLHRVSFKPALNAYTESLAVEVAPSDVAYAVRRAATDAACPLYIPAGADAQAWAADGATQHDH